MNNRKVLITGGAGFIGSHLSRLLNDIGFEVTVLDNLKPAYGDVLNQSRISQISDIELLNVDLCDLERLRSVIKDRHFFFVVHLAGWPGVRQSMNEPFKYIQNNIVAFNNLLEILGQTQASTFLYASSSSVLGKSESSTKSEDDGYFARTRSLYAVTKLMMEQIALSDTRLSQINHCGLRFFSVVGRYGRPDMAYWIFAERLLNKSPIELRGIDGGLRDYTDVVDLVEIIQRLMMLSLTRKLPSYLEIGSGNSFPTSEIIRTYEKELKLKADIIQVPILNWEMSETKADYKSLKSLIGHFEWKDKRETFREFARWYRDWSN